MAVRYTEKTVSLAELHSVEAKETSTENMSNAIADSNQSVHSLFVIL